jgi:mRNA interferase MazF
MPSTSSPPHDRGDVVWMDLDPQAGREQAGRRPVVVLSPERYNARVSLIVCCPITSRVKGYPFEVAIPAGLPVEGVVLADQVKSLDWKARNAERIGRLPESLTNEILAKVRTLL